MYKIISGFEKYSISCDGTIKNNKTGKILKPQINSSGYYIVRLSDKHNFTETVYVHRLVALNWLDYIKGCVVNHKDGNKQNNHYTNLEWVTQQDNIKHAWKTGLSKHHTWSCEN